mmetsp:Transcript_24218/g.50100  ORF Transcript_24218/g.50100 Transcript_24218/m.50100 type:complete len:258 (-) Transcript_24218:26-799(-)|eukprot:CAMPEP_0182536180 /NCGR_PEP_ID=MMETSP1323-20130603/19488_1 /TAXON_ID=236787 /ORGANISM="Florenciella parvula, Strain RCC1693" /LENGTH=257 /DNA_ID=CAMNT_0024746387 /DNA_START=227 /DNA_END=1000 /DNA_ORIENTATION=+
MARVKDVYLVRHGESTYNQWRKQSYTTCFCTCMMGHCCDPLIRDAPLSARGEKQVKELAAAVQAADWAKRVTTVVVSPLTRALATALGGFGHLESVRFVVHPLAAEHLDTMCDVGSDVPSLKEKFGDDQRIDWSIVEARGAGGDGEWWYKPGDAPSNPPADEIIPRKEPTDAVMERIKTFKADLSIMPEPCLVVVGHSSFFKRMLGEYTKMSNCEVRYVEMQFGGSGSIELEEREPGSSERMISEDCNNQTPMIEMT